MIEKTPQDESLLRVEEVKKIMHVTYQAVIMALKSQKLKGIKKNGKWYINSKDVEEYKKNKYVREKSVRNGELVFDPDKNEYSTFQAACLLKCKIQRIYYLLRLGRLKGSRKGSTWVITENNVNDYLEKLKKNDENQLKII